jgi:hypothetical protein
MSTTTITYSERSNKASSVAEGLTFSRIAPGLSGKPSQSTSPVMHGPVFTPVEHRQGGGRTRGWVGEKAEEGGGRRHLR